MAIQEKFHSQNVSLILRSVKTRELFYCVKRLCLRKELFSTSNYPCVHKKYFIEIEILEKNAIIKKNNIL